jgi:hypothetical protein
MILFAAAAGENFSMPFISAESNLVNWSNPPPGTRMAI